MTRRVVLVRHPPVDACFAGLCYGHADVTLGRDGLAVAESLARSLTSVPVDHLYHSGLSRAAAVADAISRLTGVPAVVDERLRERHFGAWERQTWDAIYAATGDAMMGMLTDPAGWRPPGGETTFALRDRVMEWYRALPSAGRVVAIMHGGPIAALRGTLRGLPVSEWLGLIPPPGAVVEL